MSDLDRFLIAQSKSVYLRARGELEHGLKETHWMWYVFPQLRALGRSDTAVRYGIVDLDEAVRYSLHPVLGPRLAECAWLVATLEHLRARHVFGGIDEVKLRSSMTLFSTAAPHEPAFALVLERQFGGRPDPLTVALIKEEMAMAKCTHELGCNKGSRLHAASCPRFVPKAGWEVCRSCEGRRYFDDGVGVGRPCQRCGAGGTVPLLNPPAGPSAQDSQRWMAASGGVFAPEAVPSDPARCWNCDNARLHQPLPGGGLDCTLALIASGALTSTGAPVSNWTGETWREWLASGGEPRVAAWMGFDGSP